MNYREFCLSSGRRFTRSHVVLLTARALSRTLRVLCCSLCFLRNFLCIVLSNGGNRGLRVRVITAAAVRLWCLLVCLLVTSWPPLCDESTGWQVDRVTSWPVTSRPGDELTFDELTGWRVDLWRVDRVMSWPLTSWPGDELTCDESTGWRVGWQPKKSGKQ